MNKTDIEYATHSWNPLAMKCTKCSPGCDHCWHLRMVKRLAGNPVINDDQRRAYAGETGPVLIEDRLRAPSKRKASAKIVVQLMGDLFHPDVPKHFIHRVFHAIEQCPQHAFFVLTKRPERMASIIKNHWIIKPQLSNVMFGVTVCNQQEANEKIPVLLSIPSVKRWLSVEPMLGPIRLDSEWIKGGCVDHCESLMGVSCEPKEFCRSRDDGIDFVAIGTESINGRPGRQPRVDYIRFIVSQCKDAGVPIMLKQMAVDGEMVSIPHLDGVQHKDMPR